MGQRMSSLRRAIALGNAQGLEKILQEAGEGSSDLINEDYTSDCFFCCFRNVQSPLHTAMTFPGSQNEQPNMVELLVRHGADVNAPNMEHGRTPLHRAGLQANVWLAQLFLDHGADVLAEDYEGNKPLHSACSAVRAIQYNNAAVVELLLTRLDSVDDINAKNNKGNTALHLAARADFAPAIACLLKKGADPAILNMDGKRAFDLAGNAGKKVLNVH